MGRSVATVPDATAIAYQTFEPSHYCESCDDFCDQHQDELFCEAYCDHTDEFDSLIEWLQEQGSTAWPSMQTEDRWIGNEVRVILANAHSIITVSEYMGMVSICLGSNYDRNTYWRDPSPTLGEHWRKQIDAKFQALYSEYHKLGTFSNGESVYTKIGA